MEFLRATGSPVCARLRGLIRHAEVATTEVVMMELLAGARDASHLKSLRGLLLGCSLVTAHGLSDYEAAAAIYRRCRARGETIRALTDCLVAGIAIREGLPVLHADADFEAIARHTDLVTAQAA
ncbi:MAG: PIN domain nuclease [Candidatus Dormibacteria bacterium]